MLIVVRFVGKRVQKIIFFQILYRVLGTVSEHHNDPNPNTYVTEFNGIIDRILNPIRGGDRQRHMREDNSHDRLAEYRRHRRLLSVNPDSDVEDVNSLAVNPPEPVRRSSRLRAAVNRGSFHIRTR